MARFGLIMALVRALFRSVALQGDCASLRGLVMAMLVLVFWGPHISAEFISSTVVRDSICRLVRSAGFCHGLLYGPSSVVAITVKGWYKNKTDTLI